MNDDLALPIAETFVSPQGEGMYNGTLMIFLRLAGCTVGTRYPKDKYQLELKPRAEGLSTLANASLFPIYTNECHLYDGRTFPCDTDYRKASEVKTRLIVDELLATHPTCKKVCLTGGEPLMHNPAVLSSLVKFMKRGGYKIYLETSGTIPLTTELKVNVLTNMEHVAIAPKENYIKEYVYFANEYKFLVDEHFDYEAFRKFVIHIELQKIPIYLQPVNFEHQVSNDNLQRCLDLQMQFPDLRISVQTHKFLGVK